jgi:hypothetical protein
MARTSFHSGVRLLLMTRVVRMSSLVVNSSTKGSDLPACRHASNREQQSKSVQ